MTAIEPLIEPPAALAAVTGEHIHEALRAASKPQTVDWIVRQFPKPLRKDKGAIAAAVQSEVAAGRLWEHPASRGKATYYHQSRDALSVAALLQKLGAAKTGQVTESAAVKALAKLSGLPRAAELLSELTAAGRIHRRPSLTGKSVNYGLTPIDPRDYFAKPLARFEGELVKLSVRLGMSLEELRRAAALALVPSGTADSVGTTAPHKAEVKVAVSVADELLQAMRDINPRVETGDVVSIPELRSRLAFRFEKPEFDRGLLDLAESWRVTLHFYNAAAALPSAERLPLVEDEQGRCYNVVSLRRD